MNQTQIESMRLALGALEGLINRTSAQSIYSFMETERRIAISACVGLREALAEQPAPMIRGDIRDGLVDDEPAQQEPGRNHWEDGDVFERIGAMKKQPAQQEQNRQIDQLIQERDHRDEIIDKLCDAVLGPDRYEWSSQYFFEDAVREVEERMAEQPAQQEPVREMPSNTRYAVAVEGQALTYWDNLHDAITNAQRAVYAGPNETSRAIDDLKAGRLAEWSYGFSAVRIYPPQNTSPQPAQRKPLTDGWILGMWPDTGFPHLVLKFARAIEAAHGIKGDA